MANVIVESTHVRSTVAEWCARNCQAEIHYAPSEAGVKTARVRLLLLDGDTICTDKPQNIQDGVDLCSGQAIQVYVTIGDDRWEFDSRIVKMTRIVRLNQKQRLLGMEIAVPDRLHPHQRRRNFRLSIASMGIACEVTAVSEACATACDADAMPLRGEIANISVRGLGVVLTHVPASCFTTGAHYYLDFELPGCGSRCVLLAQARHARKVPSRDNLMVGFRFLPTPLVDPIILRKQLNLFLAAEQRRKLRRRR